MFITVWVLVLVLVLAFVFGAGFVLVWLGTRSTIEVPNDGTT